MSERIDTTARRPFPRLSKIGNQMNYSANTDPELRSWLRWASESGKVPVFVRTVAEAASLPA